MALRIFETDPDAAPKPSNQFADDVVGRFRSGRMVGKAPESLAEWRITTGDPSVADAVAGMYGGHPQEWETTREDGIEVLTNTPKVDVVISGSSAITARMVLWSAQGQPIHECDGMEFLDEDRKGEPCGCPPLMAERKDQARKGIGPKPSVSVRFRLADDPELGIFRFQSSSWDLVRDLHNVENALDSVGGPARASLTLELVEFVPKNGAMAGRTVSYRKPVIRVFGAYEDE